MVKHNNVLHKAHLRKHWQMRVKCYFNKTAHKKIRAQKRQDKEADRLPVPLGKLRPVVFSCTQRYAGKTRIGRGFTLAEVKAAGLTAAFARSVGIAVDHRRHNKNADMMDANVQRIKAYKEKLVLFPRKENKPKSGGEIADSSAANVKKVQASGSSTEVLKLPAKAEQAPEFLPLTKQMATFGAFAKTRELRLTKRDFGRKERKAKLAAAAKK